jgi:hypothetical protein
MQGWLVSRARLPFDCGKGVGEEGATGASDDSIMLYRFL